MLLQTLFSGINYCGELPQMQALHVTADSRRIQAGSVFVCIKGRSFDGHDYAKKALEQGAALVVTQHSLGLKNEVTVQNTRLAYSAICANFFGNPAKKLKLVAVTGTNGKTTVTNLLKQLLQMQGYKTGLIGTIQNEIDGMVLPAKFTTPEPYDINALFTRMLSAGCTHVVMEASSQALEQGRLLGIEFECGVFTNLTQDHLDYHGDMQSYFEAKKLLFKQCKTAVINYDDEYGRRLAAEVDIPCITFSNQSDETDFTAKNIELKIDSVRFEMVGKSFIKRVNLPMPGAYSVHNALAAAIAASTVGVQLDVAAEGLGAVSSVRGRCEVLHKGEFTIICDFAHTGDGIETVLRTIKPFVEAKLYVLFGCAGERDKKKRPLMAKAAAAYADYIILSSDNPRGESPLEIIGEVEQALKAYKVPFESEVDRRIAIKTAIGKLKKGDVLVLCGKGHEDYQVIKGVTLYLDEHDIVKKALNELGIS